MPPKAALGARVPRESRSVAVASTHPAAAAKRATTLKKKMSSPIRESPPRSAKTIANKKIHDQVILNERIPVASIVHDAAETTPGVTVDLARVERSSTGNAPHDDIQGGETCIDEEIVVTVASMPPLWNAWWCVGCRAVNYVGDGGELLGACVGCGEHSPARNDVMLDPDQVEQVKATPGLSYDTIMTENVCPPPSLGPKTSGMTDDDLLASSPESSKYSDTDFQFEKTDLEVSKFSFFERLDHYMERHPINEDNRRAVEIAVMVEAGSIVRELGTMTKESREKKYYEEYLGLISDIPSDRFEDESVREEMKVRFKGMRKGGDMTPTNLLRKYEGELASLKKFAYKFPGFGNSSKLPSGTAQLQQLRRPFVAKLWAENNPVSLY